jgi:anti-anti-sigma regulatory factor
MANSFMEIKNGTAIVHIEGTAVIDNAVQIHQTFSEALESQLSIVLELDKVTDCDGTFVQLIASLCYTLNRGGRSLEFGQNTLPEQIVQSIKDIGFHFRCKCTRINDVECLFTKMVNNSEKKQGVLL